VTVAPTAKIAVGLLTEEQEFQLMQAEDARATGARLGIEVEVLFAENNAILQIQQLFKFVHAAEEDRPAAIVVETVTGEGLERVARNAVKAGVGWVLLNRSVDYLAELRQQRSDLCISMVTVDQQEIGRIQARQFRALLPRGGSLLYVQGPPDTSAARERLAGMEEGIQGAGIECRVLNGDWTEESGHKAVEAWLRLKTSSGFRPDVVGAQNDAMAVGARTALAAAHPEWSGTSFTGFDGLPEGGQRLVAEDVLAATIIGPTTTGPAVELVAGAFGGGEVPSEIVLQPESYPPVDELAARAGGRS
jgi:ABC-type sugar transport system substrate-binding protein